ncbi:sigma-54-dependent transcriptional regulator [Thermicanus aegyptius]|uniref:sigma-54-dependent transcriptional regulator n=1 Tax=Thermicanus aegyptius TaxID=94009 RepID=UPI00040BB36A|nr:sigma-54 dependent transcriptional regulator [Thermicanus aegyptius]
MNEEAHVLIVDDETDLLGLLVERLQRKKYRVEGYASPLEALEKADLSSCDVGIFDIKMPGMDGIALLKEAKRRNPLMEIIMLTGHGTIETAIEAMKGGAYDYLTKPYHLQELEVILQKAMEKKRLFEENQRLREALQMEGAQFQIIGEDPAMKRILHMTRRVAQSQASVLIEGESGTGKELIARAIHAWSDRNGQPFIAINSGSLMESLLESELFGHSKGAFTGATSEKKGLVEMAHKGTLFLDEIGEMPFSLQVKLLRFLESGEFRRVGETKLRTVDVRVVAATNRNLEEEIGKGNFREDLYYRLNVLKLTVPPLRERLSDIPLLAQYFLDRFQASYGKKSFTEEAFHLLLSHSYPGNVRELAHIVERGVLLSQGEWIRGEDLFPQGISSIGSAQRKTGGEKMGEKESGGRKREEGTGLGGEKVPKEEEELEERGEGSAIGEGGAKEEEVGKKREPEEHAGEDLLLPLEEMEKRHILRVLKECRGNKSKAAQILRISLRNLYRKLEAYGVKEER